MSSGDAASSKMIVLKSSDGETFEVEEAVAVESQTIKHMIEDNCADTCIPLPNVTSKILAKVIEYCKRHVDAAAKANADGALTPADKVVDEDLKAFDTEFVKVDQGTLFDLILVCPLCSCSFAIFLWFLVLGNVLPFPLFMIYTCRI